jgi:hypothetical protein
MSRDVIRFESCPYRVGDLVECVCTNQRATVVAVKNEHVYCCTDAGVWFYRTWSHQRGGLKLITRQPN